MSPRLTPEQRMDREMQKLKDMGVTVSVRLAAGVPEGADERPFGIIREAARRAGIHEEPKG